MPLPYPSSLHQKHPRRWLMRGAVELSRGFERCLCFVIYDDPRREADADIDRGDVHHDVGWRYAALKRPCSVFSHLYPRIIEGFPEILLHRAVDERADAGDGDCERQPVFESQLHTLRLLRIRRSYPHP